MKNNIIVNILLDTIDTVAKVLKDPAVITDKLGINEIFEYTTGRSLNKNIKNNLYAENKSNDKENTQKIPSEDVKPYNSLSNDYYNRKQSAPSTAQGLLDSITQEITPVRLQQAIILSEIVGKPRSKTRKRRRF